MSARFTFTCDETNGGIADVPLCEGCAPKPQFVDCDGGLLDVVTDDLGNPVIQFCDTNIDTEACVVEWSSAATTTPDTAGITGNLCWAFDTATQCFTHMSYNGAWFDKCCGCGSVVEPPDALSVCYDLAGAAGTDGYCFGGTGSNGQTGWFINSINQYSVDCGGGITADIQNTADPQTVLASTGYNNAQGIPPDHNLMPGLFNDAFDIGQGNGAATVVSVSGDPNTAPYHGSDRPLIFVDFGITDPECTGEFAVEFTIETPGRIIGVALYDKAANVFLDITSVPNFSPAGLGYSAGFGNVLGGTGPGDFLVIDSSGATQPGVVSNLLFGNSGNVQASDVCVMFTSLGNNPGPNTVEEISNIELTYIREEVIQEPGSCCECHVTSGDVASILNGNDPNNLTWVANGNLVCAEVPSESFGSQYGPLVFCDGSVTPSIVGTGDAVAFTSVPPAELCHETATQFCATCAGGDVGFQELINGVWVNV